MLADKAFCDMVHSIGVASLCADDKQIWHLTKTYWYTVEFGVVEQGGDIKAFGAGESLECLPAQFALHCPPYVAEQQQTRCRASLTSSTGP